MKNEKNNNNNKNFDGKKFEKIKCNKVKRSFVPGMIPIPVTVLRFLCEYIEIKIENRFTEY